MTEKYIIISIIVLAIISVIAIFRKVSKIAISGIFLIISGITLSELGSFVSSSLIGIGVLVIIISMTVRLKKKRLKTL